jgi:hypothetical protein
MNVCSLYDGFDTTYVLGVLMIIMERFIIFSSVLHNSLDLLFN